MGIHHQNSTSRNVKIVRNAKTETKNPVSQSFDYNTGFTYLLFKKHRYISLYPYINNNHRNNILSIKS